MKHSGHQLHKPCVKSFRPKEDSADIKLPSSQEVLFSTLPQNVRLRDQEPGFDIIFSLQLSSEAH